MCVIRQKLLQSTNRKSYTSFRLMSLLMNLKYIWRSFQPMLSFLCQFQQSLVGFRVARSPSNSWASSYAAGRGREKEKWKWNLEMCRCQFKQVIITYQGRIREGGTRGTCPLPRKFPCWKKFQWFLVNTLLQWLLAYRPMSSASGGFAPDPHRGSAPGLTVLSPSETNFWLRPCKLCTVVTARHNIRPMCVNCHWIYFSSVLIWRFRL